MLKTQFVIYLFMNLVAINKAMALVHPAAMISDLSKPEKGYFLNRQHLQMNVDKEKWNLIESQQPFLAVWSSVAGQLSLVKDDKSPNLSLKSYTKKWSRDFNLYGLEVIGNQEIKLPAGQALVLDVLDRKNQKQIRQYILSKEKTLITISCSGESKDMTTLIPECHKAIESFRWL